MAPLSVGLLSLLANRIPWLYLWLPSDSDRMSPKSPTDASTTSNGSSSTSANIASQLSSSSRTSGSGRRRVSMAPSPDDKSPPPLPPPTTTNNNNNNSDVTSGTGNETLASGGVNQLNKLKRFLSTVQQFADDISTDIGDTVRTLVLGLVVSNNLPLCFYISKISLIETILFPLHIRQCAALLILGCVPYPSRPATSGWLPSIAYGWFKRTQNNCTHCATLTCLKFNLPSLFNAAIQIRRQNSTHTQYKAVGGGIGRRL